MIPNSHGGDEKVPHTYTGDYMTEDKEYHRYTIRFFDKNVHAIGTDTGRIWHQYNTSESPLGLKESMEAVSELETRGCVVEMTRIV